MAEVDWSDSMEQTFEYYEVDPITWKDIKPLNMVKKCNSIWKIKRNYLKSERTIDSNNASDSATWNHASKIPPYLTNLPLQL